MLERLLTRVTSIPGVRSLWVRYPVGPVDTRVRFGIWTMPQYAYGVYYAAEQASRLGLSAISVMEFGVAGGRGLLALEDIARNVARHIGIQIQVFGFDTGEGMPAAVDYRDLPHVWERGYYKMDVEKLKKRLSGAELADVFVVTGVLRPNHIVEVAVDTRQTGLRTRFEQTQRGHCGAVVIEIERYESDRRLIRTGKETRDRFRDISQDELRAAQPLL